MAQQAIPAFFGHQIEVQQFAEIDHRVHIEEQRARLVEHDRHFPDFHFVFSFWPRCGLSIQIETHQRMGFAVMRKTPVTTMRSSSGMLGLRDITIPVNIQIPVPGPGSARHKLESVPASKSVRTFCCESVDSLWM